MNEHPACGPDRSDCILPTRLLDLESRDNPSLIRLTDTTALRKDSPYLALSHCWGGKSSLMLKVGNVDYLKQSIDLFELPLSFQRSLTGTFPEGPLPLD